MTWRIFQGLFWKLLRLEMLLVFLSIGMVLLVIVSYQLEREKKEIIQRITLLSKIITHEIESNYVRGFFPYKILNMASEAEDIAFIWVAKPDGEIFWADDFQKMGEIIQDPFLGVEEFRIRDINFPKKREKFEEGKLVATPVRIELAGKSWTLFLGISLEQLKNAQKEILFLGIGVLILVLTIIGFFSYYLSKKIIRPIRTLQKGAENIGKGNLDYRIKIKTGDEIEELAEEFNRMAEGLNRSKSVLKESKAVLEIKVEARTKELKGLTESLEEKVKQRTKELQERIDELERYHRLTVGRELKMVELKKEIEILKKELEK